MKNVTAARIVLALLVAVAAGAGSIARPGPNAEMSAAAARFLGSLTPELRAKAALAFEPAVREKWQYVPATRDGVSFAEMNDAQKMAARDLIRSALSPRGVGKVEQIMMLDAVLGEIEQGRGPARDPLAYSIAVYGTPGAEGSWGWRIEGHHISLNFTGRGGAACATPAFLGANPAEVRRGDRAGVRVLAVEEDLGRELLRSLDAGQMKEALIGETAPPDILSVPGRSLEEVSSVGLAVAAMSGVQRQKVERLLEEYAGNLRYELAAKEMERIRAAGIEKVRFAWAGSADRGKGHYYRLSGPTFVIEYDNTQNDANHVHTVWHDRERDFGHDLLKEHLERGSGK